jgi:hypothetical protein
MYFTIQQCRLTKENHRANWSCSDVSDSYSGGAPFESRAGHLSWLRFLMFSSVPPSILVTAGSFKTISSVSTDAIQSVPGGKVNRTHVHLHLFLSMTDTVTAVTYQNTDLDYSLANNTVVNTPTLLPKRQHNLAASSSVSV